MSLLGIDVGTTACKAAVFSDSGETLSSESAEYDLLSPRPDWVELDAPRVWKAVQACVRGAARAATGRDPLRALAAASMGEAVVPVSRDREILGPSILMNDPRGAEYVAEVRSRVSDADSYRISGNPVVSQYGFTKIMWIKESLPELYARTFKFLNWASFVPFMLGAEPRVDYSLANRFLLFDLGRLDWSPRLLAACRIDREKLPDCVPAGTIVGGVAPEAAAALGLPEGLPIACGAHDQCANALGCGVVRAGQAMYGMGTFPTIVPVFESARDPEGMLRLGLNTEHHAVPGRYVSFIYHMGGAIVKWYRDTFARDEERAGLYDRLFSELPDGPGPLLVLPHFTPLGPPDYTQDSSGVILGLRTSSTRADILKGIVEGNAFLHKESVDRLASVGISIDGFTAVGGGSRSDAAVQMCADILDRPAARPFVTEAGALGAGILAGLGSGVYSSAEEAAGRIVRIERRFEPNPPTAARYREIFGKYLELSEAVGKLARDWGRLRSSPRT